MYILVMCDANRQTVGLAWAHFADNEGDSPWKIFMAFVAAKLPQFDASNVVVYRDGRSSISKCLNDHARNPRRINCVRHGAEAAQHNVGGGGVAKDYTKLASACSVAALAGYKQIQMVGANQSVKKIGGGSHICNFFRVGANQSVKKIGGG